MSDSSESSPSDTIEERVAESRLKLWMLLEADRVRLTGLLVLVVFSVLVVLGGVDSAPFPDEGVIVALFEALVTAVITGVTVVVTINQLVLSQELGSAGDQQDRMEGALAFRDEVESALGQSTSPADPGEFLASILSELGQQARQLADVGAPETDPQHQSAAGTLAEELRENVESVETRLERAEFGSFEVVSAALDFDYSGMLHETRRLHNECADSTSEEAQAALETTVELLGLYGVSREHIKTLYFQWELIDLSRVVLYAAVPALLVSVSMILYVDTLAAVGGSVFGVETLVWVTSAATAVAVLPFALLLAYVLRITTVAKRTLAIGPFVLRSTDGGDRSNS